MTARHGWVAGDVGSLVERHPGVFAALPYVLVARLDSDDRPGAGEWLPGLLARHGARAVSLRPLVLTGATVVRCGPEMFSGFDELWVLAATDAADPPSLCPITDRFDTVLPEPVREWVARWTPRLGVGDGDGMNWVATDDGLATALGLG
jgi:hypothetical protein